MNEETPMKPSRRRLALGTAVLGAALAVAGGITLSVTAGTSVGPDVTVIYLPSVQNYGAVSGVRAYAVGTTSCNVGTTPVAWCNNNGGCGSGANRLEDEDHPAIAQNLYRLKDGRFEQIGMSWLKHGFVSTNSTDGACGSCQGPPLGGDQLGVGCTDAYGASLNGSRPMGQRGDWRVPLPDHRGRHEHRHRPAHAGPRERDGPGPQRGRQVLDRRPLHLP
jgi:hypothetical protein